MDPVLIMVSRQGLGRKYRLGDEAVLIGRHPACAVQVVDSQVSKEHARIARQGEAHTVEDLGSLNGVFVNGEKVAAPQTLAPNDIITVGSFAFLYAPALEVIPNDAGDHALVLTSERRSATRVESRAARDKAAEEADPLEALVVRLGQGLSGGKLWDVVTEHLRARIGFDAAAILDLTEGNVEPLHIVSPIRTLSVPRTIVDACVQKREGVAIGDAIGDTFFSKAQSVVQGKVRSVLAAPLCAGDDCLGVAYLTRDEANAYGEAQLDELLAMAPGLALAVRLSQSLNELQRQVAHGREQSAGPPQVILGQSAAIEAVRTFVAKAARAPSPVLILGDTGSGKELIARQLHDDGPGPGAPFVPVNCGAVPEQLMESEFFGHEKGAFSGATRRKPGKLELAGGGTLFLDEIAELPLDLQVKLLRALEERSFYRLGGVKPITVDFRLVAATHRDLKTMVAEGTFRQDLYFRINVLAIHNPALRERPEDIELLGGFFIDRFNRELGCELEGFEPEALAALRRYAWPGNVRELRNVLERLAVFGEHPLITLGDLPPEIAEAGDQPPVANEQGTLPERVAGVERRAIVEAMAAAKGKKAAAAKKLGISRPTLDKKLALYDIDRDGGGA